MSNMLAEIPREKLKELIDKNGESLLQDPDRCEGLLKDHCGAHRREISALVGALEERVPMELKSSWQTAMTPEAMRARLVQRLEDNRGLAPDVAIWAVDAWSYALNVGLVRVSDRVPANNGAGVVAGVAGAALTGAALTPNAHAASIAERVASDRPGGAMATITQLSPQKKAGAGAAIGLLALAGIAYAMHRPTPQPQPVPTPVVVVNPTPIKKTSASDPTPVVKLPPAPLIDAGSTVVVRLDDTVSSDTASIGQLVTATVSSPITHDGNVIVSSGSTAHLRVTSIEPGAHGGASHMQLALVDVGTTTGRLHLSTFAQHFTGPIAVATGSGAKRVGIAAAGGAVVGGVVGHLFHHTKSGVLVGAGGGGVAADVTAQSPPVKVQAETVLHFKLARAVMSTKGDQS